MTTANDRQLLAAVAAIIVVGLAAGAADIASAHQEKPNIVVIWGDDIGQSNSSAYPRSSTCERTLTNVRTSHRIPITTGCSTTFPVRARSGNNFHTTALCSPTRAALITGRNHHTCASGVIT